MAVRTFRLYGILLCTSLMVGQNARPRFEVASVKPSPPGDGRLVARIEPGRITLGNYPLRGMIRSAYGLRASELAGGPAWMESATYDITAKAEKPAGGVELWLMMQPLLEERFKLKMHVEKREFPIFNLVIATPGKLAAPREGSCIDSDKTMPPREPAPGRPMLAPCGSILMPNNGGRAAFDGGQVRMAMLASRVTDLVGRKVIDKTGFTGAFDIHMKFAFEGLGNAGQPAAAGEPSDPTGLPNIVTALRDQLGLRLEPGKAMLDVHVIDSVERPTGN